MHIRAILLQHIKGKIVAKKRKKGKGNNAATRAAREAVGLRGMRENDSPVYEVA